jgi:hypothetical protein
MRNNCSGHCWCYTGWGGLDSKIPLAVAVLVVLGSAARTVTDAAEGLADWKGAARGSVPGPGTARAGSGEVSPDAAAGDARQWAAGGVAGDAGVDAAGGGLAVASLAPGGGDAGRSFSQQRGGLGQQHTRRA